jgi:hypothetical protein
MVSEYDEGKILVEHETKLKIHKEKLEGMDKYLIMKEFVKNMMEAQSTYNGWDKLSFCDAVRERGVADDHAWRNQTFYNKYAIMYLLSIQRDSKNVEEHIRDLVDDRFVELDDDNLQGRAEETFGLLCASGRYSKLAIAQVPALLNWAISEYDGLERVYVE